MPYLLIALVVASAYGWIQTIRLHAAQDRVAVVQAHYDQFKTGVAAEGKLAQQRADAQARADKLRKGKADENQKRALDALRSDNDSLRRDADRAGSYSLPAPAPDAARPDVACFDRGSFELASRNALAGLREIADECDAARISLNIAKAWAKERPASP